MQEHGASSTGFVGTEVPYSRGASWDRRDGRQTTDLMAPYALRAGELAALKRAQQAHARSMMMLVHELRSPAAASKSMVATFRYLNPQDTQLDRFLAKIEDRMDQLLDLVNDILDLTQAKAGRPLGQAAILDLVAETGTVCEPYLEATAAKGLAMSVELPEYSVRVHMPEKAYHVIASNLISNAVKYTSVGSVRVTLRKKGAWAVLAVHDTGIGVPDGEMCHLFTEFFRASNARAGCSPGTGLGLAAVKALVEGYNGELELQSEENKGTRFTVRLPLCRVHAAQEVESCLQAKRKER
jgi:signal transduction histidine kinase